MLINSVFKRFARLNLLMTTSLTLMIIILTGFSLNSTACAQTKNVERVAVLDLVNKAGIKQAELENLSDLLRQVVSKLPKEHYWLMTKDNILVMLPPGKSIEDCVGSSAVETGRNLGVHWVLAGQVVRFAKSLRVTLKLHHSPSGALKGSDVVVGKTLAKLEKPLQRSALSLFSAIDTRVEIDVETSADTNEFVQADDDFATKLTQEFFKDAQAVRKQDLAQAHRTMVERSWAKAKQVVKRGDHKAKKALKVFLETYADHERGNPLAEEAQAFYDQAKQIQDKKRDGILKAKHHVKVKQEWIKLKPLLKKKGKLADKAIKLFLKRYAKHPLGNPLANTAYFALEANARGEDTSNLSIFLENSRVISGKPSIGNFCKIADILRVVNFRQRDIQYCYERELARSPVLDGKVILNWNIGLDGRVMKVWVGSSTLKNGAVESCMTRSVKRWKFTKPDGGICQIKFPFVFNSSKESR